MLCEQTVRREERLLCERIEIDDTLKREKTHEYALAQYEIELIGRLIKTCAEPDRSYWEIEQAIMKHQCELLRLDLNRFEEKLARNRELLAVVQRDLESSYR